MRDPDPVDFFAGLSDHEQRDLVALARTRRYERGSTVLREEDEGSFVMILREGTVKISMSAPSGREVILHVFEPGSLFGELARIDGKPRSGTVVALTDVDVLVVKHAEFLAFLDRNAGAAKALLRVVVAKLRVASQRQLEFVTSGALPRVCRALLELGARYGEETPQGTAFRLPMSQHDLAAFVGLSREAVVKALISLRSLGWIATAGREVTLTNGTALSECPDAG